MRTVLRMTGREYSIPEAAEILGYAVSTLRDRVTQARVPHHRRFRVKGVFFTDEDIAAIQNGTGVQVGDRRRTRGDVLGSIEAARSDELPDLGPFVGLRSLRST